MAYNRDGAGRGATTASGGKEEKAYHSHARDKQDRNVNTSNRPMNGSSSRFSHTSTYNNRSRSPYRERSKSPWRAPRERSRSPYRAPKTGEKRGYNNEHHGDEKRVKPAKHVDVRKDTGKYHADKRERSRSPFRHNRQDQDRKPSVKETEPQPAVEYDMPRSEESCTDIGSEPVEEPQLTEAELIEQRRKRREAIKAKHKQQPLLVQALEQTTASNPSTPLHEMNYDQSPISPRTPAADSPGAAPFSPNSFSADEIQAFIDKSQAQVVEDGPSAADYNPDMDMQEDRRNLKDKPVKEKKEPDMFADDDDDDMFASESNIKHNKVEAKTLDASLLDNWDYPDGHYRVIIGELLNGKYAVQQQIGKGTFATVVRAQETSTGRAVAVKIACNNDTMYKAGTKELDFLTILNETDPEDKRHIIRLLGRFDHKGHMCLVFENLSADLRETLKKYGRNVGITLSALRTYSHQMFQALLHMQRNEILHADLKPDNILVSEKKNLLKICDLGTAAKINDTEVTPYLVSRFYRAPEVMLGMPFDYAIDMWSIGCTLFELHTGRILFAGSDNNQMLRAIQECRGRIPNRMLKKSTLFDRHFDQFGNFISIEHDRITGQTSMRQPNLAKPLQGKDLRTRMMASIKDASPVTLKETQAFIDLVDKCLQLDPARRITPADALKHYFITRITPSEQQEKKKISALAPARIK